jgi:beta-galactosidase beta subunit
MPKNLPFGQYDLDHKIVTAVYSEYAVGNVETTFKKSNPVAQIHYVIEGCEKISFLTTKKGLLNRSDDPSSQSDLSATVATQSSGDFIVTLPDNNYHAVVSIAEAAVLRKVLVSIPIQRIV